MVDWSLFNIVSVAVALALILFFLVAAVGVAAKGKRRRGGFDIFLRIFSSIVFAFSAVLFACAVLTLVSGDFGISVVNIPASEGVAGELSAWLIMGGEASELPFPALFLLLSSQIGIALVAGLLICSLVALVVDCLVANKKEAVQKSNLTPEQIKRNAELDRIRKIGENAVRKTNDAAQATGARTDGAQIAETPESADAQSDEAPETDWRTEPPHETGSQFVGLKENEDGGDFDSFDTFDEAVDEQSAEDTQYEENAEQGEYTDEAVDEQPEEYTDEGVDEQPEEYTDETVDEQPEEYADEGVDEQSEEYTDEEVDEQPEEYADEGVDEQPEKYTDEVVEQPEPQKVVEPTVVRPEPQKVVEPTPVRPEPQKIVEPTPVRPEPQKIVEPTAVRPERTESEDDTDRGIYIPEIRTIEKSKPVSKPAEKKPRAKRSAPAKPKSARPAVMRTSETRADARLPVTRRYVILDRRNAVNMFGEYLKERNQAEKDKLKSSINTIIIE